MGEWKENWNENWDGNNSGFLFYFFLVVKHA